MFGEKLKEFDNSDGTVKSFNEIFPNTQLEGGRYVEILDIVDSDNVLSSNLFVRNLDIDGNIVKHDFGRNNFFYDEGILVEGNVRFKYIAKDLEGKIIAKAYNFKDLSDLLGCHINIVKDRFNITRKEL